MNTQLSNSTRSFRRAGLMAAATVLLAIATPAFAQDGKADAPNPKFHTKDAIKQYNVSKKTLAIEGYDPVAYFPEGGGKPQEGDKNITFTHNAITYRFASKEHLDLFKANPDKYEPSHGGWCTYAMGANGEKVEVDPESYVVENGRLFLFYKDIFTDTRKKFLAEKVKLLAAADTNWKKTAGEEPRTPENLAKEKGTPEDAKKDAKKDGEKPATEPATDAPKNPK
ncbi:MAG: YHS domain-containing (seleno)protein [Phycisphaerales bacterium]|jgi:hypothetical protein